MTTSYQKASKPQYVYSILSLTLVLTILGLLGLLTYKAQTFVQQLKESINIIIELKSDVSNDAVQTIENTLRTKPFLKQGTLKFVNKETGAAFMKKEFGEDILILGLDNPLHDIFTLNVNAVYMDQDSLATIKQNLVQLEGVNDVYYQSGMMDTIANNLNRMTYVGLGIGSILLLMSILLIYSTVQLALNNNRLLIKKMQLVGAADPFIKKPYINRSRIHGIISVILSIGIILGTSWWLNQQLPEFDLLNNPIEIAILFGVILILGIGLFTMSTRYTVNRFLKTDAKSLY